MTRSALVVADYDPATDVLYLALGEPRPAESEESPTGLLLRYDNETDEPCGVTVLRLAKWRDRRAELEDEVSGFLHVSRSAVREALGRVLP